MSATATIIDHLTAPADVTRETRLGDVIESVTCGRCGGSGRMPYSVANGVCFKCGGRGRVDTKRGAAARAFFRQLADTPVEAIRPGDKVRYEGFQAGGYTQPSAWVTVERVVDTAAEAAAIGNYGEALRAAGSCSTIDTAEKVEAAAEAGATILPTGRGDFAVFSGLRIEGATKTGESFRLGESRGSVKYVPLSREVMVAVLKTVAEYQLRLTKAGKPRKGTRWAD